jgi:molybdate transport system substrate-binding protein
MAGRLTILGALMGCTAAVTCTGAIGDDGRAGVSVFAASSLVDAFSELEAEFERANPDVDVQMTFAGSQVLRLQLEQGAPAHVFASANLEHMRALVEQGLVEEPESLGANELVIVVPTTNPAAIRSIDDLPDAERIVIGAPNVPIGVYTNEMLTRAAGAMGRDFTDRVMDRVVSLESNARLVRAKVELGEADAAIVYRTDGLASDRVLTIELPPPLRVPARYWIAATHSPSAVAAPAGTLADGVSRLLAFTHSEAGQGILRRHGFAPKRP